MRLHPAGSTQHCDPHARCCLLLSDADLLGGADGIDLGSAGAGGEGARWSAAQGLSRPHEFRLAPCFRRMLSPCMRVGKQLRRAALRCIVAHRRHYCLSVTAALSLLPLSPCTSRSLLLSLLHTLHPVPADGRRGRRAAGQAALSRHASKSLRPDCCWCPTTLLASSHDIVIFASEHARTRTHMHKLHTA